MSNQTSKRKLSTPLLLVIIVFCVFIAIKIFKEAANDVKKTKEHTEKTR